VAESQLSLISSTKAGYKKIRNQKPEISASTLTFAVLSQTMGSGVPNEICKARFSTGIL
jgi:hypothetical protein